MRHDGLTITDTCRTMAASIGLVTRLKHRTVNPNPLGSGLRQSVWKGYGPTILRQTKPKARSPMGFFLAATRQGALVNEPAWAAPEKHRPSYTRKRCRLACQRGTRKHAGASGETNPAWKESLPPGWPGVFGLFKYLGREESHRAFTLGESMPKSRMDSQKSGGHNPSIAAQ